MHTEDTLSHALLTSCQALAWSLERKNHTICSLLQALAKGCYQRLADFGTQSIANVFWAFGHINYYHEGLFRATAVETAGGPCTTCLSTLHFAIRSCIHLFPPVPLPFMHHPFELLRLCIQKLRLPASFYGYAYHTTACL